MREAADEYNRKVAQQNYELRKAADERAQKEAEDKAAARKADEKRRDDELAAKIKYWDSLAQKNIAAAQNGGSLPRRGSGGSGGGKKNDYDEFAEFAEWEEKYPEEAADFLARNNVETGRGNSKTLNKDMAKRANRQFRQKYGKNKTSSSGNGTRASNKWDKYKVKK